MKNIYAAFLLMILVLYPYVTDAREHGGLDERRIAELRNMVENTRIDLTPLLKYARRPPSDGQNRTLPAQFSWHNLNGQDWMSPVRDQGGCGSCWTFGTIAALEGAINIYLNDATFDYDLSEQHMVSCGAGSCANGGMAEEVLGYLRNNGIPDEACFPYQASELSCSLTCSDWQARAVKISNWGLMLNPTEQELKTELLNGPLPVTMKVTSGFYSYSGGVYVGSSETCNLLTNQPNHVVALVGWDDSDNTWIAKNSWNTDWGIDGYIKIRRGTDCFATVSADWLRVDPPTIPGVDGDVALCISPAVLNIEVPEGEESTQIPITLSNCGDFATDWSMDTTGTWKYWIYPAPFHGDLAVDQSVTVNLVVDASQKEAGSVFDVLLSFIPALSGQKAQISLKITITGDEPVDGDTETPADGDDTAPDGDMDEDSPDELDGEIPPETDDEGSEIETVEDGESAESLGDVDGYENSDGDWSESETLADGDLAESFENQVNDGDEDSESKTEGDSAMPDGNLQTVNSGGVCGLSGSPQGALLLLLISVLFVMRRRTLA